MGFVSIRPAAAGNQVKPATHKRLYRNQLLIQTLPLTPNVIYGVSLACLRRVSGETRSCATADTLSLQIDSCPPGTSTLLCLWRNAS